MIINKTQGFIIYQKLVGIIVCMIALLMGCNSKQISIPKTNPVSGRIIQNGKGLPGIRVVLHPLDSKQSRTLMPIGETNPQGEFVINTGSTNTGAPPGRYAILLSKPMIVSDIQNSGIENEIDLFNGKYNDPNNPIKTITIIKGVNILDPIEID